ncbi:hypothetical protein niasHT_027799 [Heterodera trifolii]|uniref:B30.2/SPRY domain-containing protein n=1 Tax=Heterodera trifolii TaxID=157864 RepID=A0ABD2JFP9_9BILA
MVSDEKDMIIKLPNQWDPKKSHKELYFFDLDYVKILSKGKHRENRYAIGEFRLSPADYYYEVKVIVMQKREDSVVSIGLWSAKTNASYAYYSNGTILGNNSYGTTGFPSFGQGDTIGCGVNLTSMNAIYTINGNTLATDLLYVTETDLFPRVSLNTPGDVIEAKFGPDFMYKIGQDVQNPISNAENVGTNENGRRFCKEIVTEANLFFKNFIRLQKNFINISKSAIKFSRAENEQRKDLRVENDIKQLQAQVDEFEKLMNKFNLDE